jgi:hypothetical protein
MNPFEFINDICYAKRNVMTEELENKYTPYVVNKGLSYFIDTVFQANEMNVHHNADNRLQYDFLLNSVRPKKRFSKWSKNNRLEEIELIKEYYGYSDDKAKDVVNILGDDHIKYIKSKLDKGGAK